ncbi:MAG: hypothetical protein JWN44_3478 [Myxococcales bacterium]|nr:hypothetical protein [Myxococcales bacterium]
MIALALAACTKGSPPSNGAAQAPAAAAPAAPTPPTNPAALTFAEGSGERQVQSFCIANYQKLGSCFDDPSFWEILATIFFAKNPTMDDGTPRTRAMWIGMRKDDFAGLMREKRVPADCEASIRHSRWPSAATMERVAKARAGACPAFANAFGTMLFVEGVFSEPR